MSQSIDMTTYYGSDHKRSIFYDPNIRLWTLIRLDGEGYQYGDAEYRVHRHDAIAWLNSRTSRARATYQSKSPDNRNT